MTLSAIELICLTLRTKHCMTLSANEDNQTHWSTSGSTAHQTLKAIELIYVPQVALHTKHCMTLSAIESNQADPFASVALHTKHCMTLSAIKDNRAHLSALVTMHPKHCLRFECNR